MADSTNDLLSLRGRSAIVTGGGRGIGRAIATELARAGSNLIITYRANSSLADAAAHELRALGVGCQTVQADVRESVDIDRVVKECQQSFGSLDILVNNAGMTSDNLVMRMSEDAWDDVMNTNLRGTFLATKAALRPMVRARWGRIINITSVVGVTGNAGQANYSAAKAGVIGFTRSVALEVASRGITVNAIAPGFVQTDMTSDNLVMRMSEDAWDDVMNTNLRGTFLATKAALRPMVRARWGRIINITSVVGVTGNAGQANYSAAKAGVIGFTRSVALEVASRGITVNAIAPGFVQTDMTAGLSDEQKELIKGRIPMDRYGEPSEIAPIVAFLASDAAAYITGQTVNVDGGLVMS